MEFNFHALAHRLGKFPSEIADLPEAEYFGLLAYFQIIDEEAGNA